VRWGRKRERRKRENYGVQLTDRAAEYLYGKKSIKKPGKCEHANTIHNPEYS
jgi:hypothetical protein